MRISARVLLRTAAVGMALLLFASCDMYDQVFSGPGAEVGTGVIFLGMSPVGLAPDVYTETWLDAALSLSVADTPEPVSILFAGVETHKGPQAAFFQAYGQGWTPYIGSRGAQGILLIADIYYYAGIYELQTHVTQCRFVSGSPCSVLEPGFTYEYMFDVSAVGAKKSETPAQGVKLGQQGFNRVDFGGILSPMS